MLGVLPTAMLEYLRRWDGLYPYYPQVELLGLRDECQRLQVYQEAARYFANREQNNDVILDFTGILELLDDPDVCNSWVLADLVYGLDNPVARERVLRRMRTWDDFDHGALEFIAVGGEHKEQPLYLPFREMYVKHSLKVFEKRRQKRVLRNQKLVLRRCFQAWRMV